MDQHELLIRVLCVAGGTEMESALPRDYAGERADALFERYDVVVEVKTLATDRANDPKIWDALGQMFAENVHEGAPIIFGQTKIGLHDLPENIAVKALRIAGKRVQREAAKANRQIKASKAALGRENAFGLLVLVTPPSGTDRRSLLWLVKDALRDGACSSINGVYLVETPIAAPFNVAGKIDSFLSFHSRGGRWFPRALRKRIGAAWGMVTGQGGILAREEDFHRYGASG
ncbi:hypothetical protein [Sphingomonas asaccharolytica]|uniref:hypothetical protein n=1 Tax=Sphingomonas asaccharolytica TaxID=40681 RepID=UPI00082C3410|nr:hypothetical protein [Sphingomonas asaccharolytica]